MATERADTAIEETSTPNGVRAAGGVADGAGSMVGDAATATGAGTDGAGTDGVAADGAATGTADADGMHADTADADTLATGIAVADDPHAGAEEAARQRVAAVRAFNRFYTRVLGFLEPEHLHTEHSLTEARVIFELAQRDRVELRDLRELLGLDPGYLTRIVHRFQANGLVSRQRSAADGRRQVVWLTDRGRARFRTLDARSGEQIGALLDGLTVPEQQRLTGAMGVVRDLLDDHRRPGGYLLRAPQPGELGWVVARNAALYSAEYGFDADYEALVARIVADYAEQHQPEYERGWIAELDGVPVGCVFCVRADQAEHPPATAKLRLLLVEPSARGMGIGARLVDECLRFAAQVGYRRMLLWTNSVLVSARRIYGRAGFRRVEAEPHHSFGRDLVGEVWSRDL